MDEITATMQPEPTRPITPAPRKVRDTRARDVLAEVEAQLDELPPEEARRIAGWLFDKYVRASLIF